MLGNQPDHQYFLYGESREKGNVMVVNDKGYLGPICDENWDIEEVKPRIQQTKMLLRVKCLVIYSYLGLSGSTLLITKHMI